MNANDVKGNKVLIIGMARSGIAAAKVLCQCGAVVTVNDAKDESKLDGLEELKDCCIFKLGMPADDLVVNADFIVTSPSVPPTISAIKKAVALNIPVYTEIELGYRLCPAIPVAITGTNGKTTTTTLTGKIFSDAGRGCHVVGNIGLPYISRSLTARTDDVMVTEISSYQLECIIDFHPHVAALLNITPDHLNRHGSMDGYIAVKKRIFENQTADDFAVLNYEDETVRNMADDLKAKVVFFSSKRQLDSGLFLRDGKIVFSYGVLSCELCRAEDLYIKGRHNIENAMAAAAIALLCGVSAKSVAYSLVNFKGVEHRIEYVDTVNGVSFINDSKGTNPDSTEKAICAMDKPTVLLLGGYDKGGEFYDLITTYTDNIKHTVVLGATAGKIVDALESAGNKAYTVVNTGFNDAVIKAYQIAKQHGYSNVLLSPACASWDMFSDFEQRGRVFKDIVNSLKE